VISSRESLIGSYTFACMVSVRSNRGRHIDVPDVALIGVAPLRVAESLSLFPSNLLVGSPPTVVSRASCIDSMDPECVGIATWPTIENCGSCTVSTVATSVVGAWLTRESRASCMDSMDPKHIGVAAWPTRERRASCMDSMVARVPVEALSSHDRDDPQAHGVQLYSFR
jgi:hypothetical protein